MIFRAVRGGSAGICLTSMAHRGTVRGWLSPKSAVTIRMFILFRMSDTDRRGLAGYIPGPRRYRMKSDPLDRKDLLGDYAGLPNRRLHFLERLVSRTSSTPVPMLY